MLIAQLAYRQLSPEQQQRAVEILQHLPAFDYDIGLQTKDLPSPEREARIFMLASIWPDLVRDHKHPAHFESQPGWHVTWLPLVAADYKLPAQLSKAGSVNTMEALPVLMREFTTSSSLPQERRAIHLAWILHLIGDLHQPLHAVAFYSKQWPAGDHSGSMFYVRQREDAPPEPLHKVWDGLFGFRDVPTTAIMAMADEITSDGSLSRTALQGELQKTTPREWIEESREIAKRDGYRLDTSAPLQGLPLPEGRKAEAIGGYVPALPDGYMVRAHDVARRQVAKAGDRLADFLKESLKQNF